MNQRQASFSSGESSTRQISAFRVELPEQTVPIFVGALKEQILPLDAVALHPTGVCAYCSNPKIDVAKAETYLNGMFTAHRLDGNVRVVKDLGAFERRLKGLKPASSYEDDGSVDYAAELLKNLSM